MVREVTYQFEFTLDRSQAQQVEAAADEQGFGLGEFILLALLKAVTEWTVHRKFVSPTPGFGPQESLAILFSREVHDRLVAVVRAEDLDLDEVVNRMVSRCLGEPTSFAKSAA